MIRYEGSQSARRWATLWLAAAVLAACGGGGGSPGGTGGTGGTGPDAATGGARVDGGGGGVVADAHLPTGGDARVPDGAVGGTPNPDLGGGGDARVPDGASGGDARAPDQGTGGAPPDMLPPDMAPPDLGPLPCADDTACPESRYCAASGFCEPGCRGEGAPCPADARGHQQSCDAPTHTCVPMVACCLAVNACGLTREDACDGVALEGSTSCAAQPCGPDCLSDSDCAADRFCHPVDLRCTVGCRTGDSAACPYDLTCLPDERRCGVLPCDAHADCRDPAQYCDNVGIGATDTCREGCRDDAACGLGGRCGADHACIFLCDGQNVVCPLNHVCDVPTGRCVPVCQSNDDCPADEICDALTARCAPGCRDDAFEPDDLTDEARPLVFGAPDARGLRHAAAEGRMCDLNPDVFALELPEGGRFHARLDFVGGSQAYMSVRTRDMDFGGEIAFAAPPGDLTFPPLGQPMPATTLYLTVLSEAFLGSDYTLTVDLAAGGDTCFPDATEPADNARQGAQRLLDAAGTVSGSICAADTDFLAFRMGRNDGLALSLLALPGAAPLVGELYRAARVDAAGQLPPDATTGPGIEGLDGTVYEFVAPVDTGAFSDEDWYLRIRSTAAGGQAEYRLNYVHESSVVICDDDQHTEPNNTPNEAIDLDLIAAIGAGGRLAADAPHRVPMDLSLCPGDADVFCLIGDRDDRLSAWVVADSGAGVQWIDGRGDPLTALVPGRPDGNPPAVNALGRVTAGRFCARVAGAGGPYALYVERDAPAQYLCAADPAEADPVAGVRNDTALTATTVPTADQDPLRFSIDGGYLCDVSESFDEDWYRFMPPAGDAAFCLTVSGFADSGGDVDAELYIAGSQPDGNPCASDDDCPADERCVQRLCTPPTSVQSTREDREMIARSRTESVPGAREHFLRLERGQPPGEGVGYRVDVTFTPDSPNCGPDGPELAGPNDSPETATPLGRGGAALCTTWICPNERATGDYYALTVPAGQDRTVLIEYDDLNDGRLYLYGTGPQSDPADGLSGFVRSELGVGGQQCVNLKGGAADGVAVLQVYADRLVGNRADYHLRVVGTDLDAHAAGACATLGAPDLAACPPRAQWMEFPGIGRLQPDGCWATLALP